MRDERGRYLDSKPIADSVPAWASGCPKCKGGIVSAPDVRALPLYEARAVMGDAGMIVWCGCRAGLTYRRYAQRTFRSMNPLSAKAALDHINANLAAPSMHLEMERS